MQIVADAVDSFACSVALAPFLRVVRDATNGLAAAGPEDQELGTLRNRHIVSGLGASARAAVVLANAEGTVKMVAAAAIAQWAVVYGAEGGKIDDVPNTNPIGIAKTAAADDGDTVEVLRLPNMSVTSGDEVGGLDFFDDFLGDYPVAGTALTESPWTKVETGTAGTPSVSSSDEANGVLRFAFTAHAEAQAAVLYMQNAPFDIDQNPIFEVRVSIARADVGVDINIGLASDTHATDFDAIAQYIAFHIDGGSTRIRAQSEDGATTIAAIYTAFDHNGSDIFKLKIDLTDTSDAKLYIDLEDGDGWQRVLSGTTFDMSNYSGTLTPIVHAEKASGTGLANIDVDWIRVRSERA